LNDPILDPFVDEVLGLIHLLISEIGRIGELSVEVIGVIDLLTINGHGKE
jgi:hypothetical protein